MNLEKEGLFFRHLRALFMKRAAFFRRDKKAWLCTTVLPSVFVCLGFVIFTVFAVTRNLDPIALDLNDFNREVRSSEPRNPIIFNTPTERFSCQGDVCSYGSYALGPITEERTNEEYYFCGRRARVGGTCSINESRNVTAYLVDDGAVPFGEAVDTVLNVSATLFFLNFRRRLILNSPFPLPGVDNAL